MKLRLPFLLHRALLATMATFAFSGASLLASDPIEGFNSPLLGSWGNSFGYAAWGLHLTLNDSFAARGHSGATYGGAVFSFGGSGDICGTYGRHEIIDGKEQDVTYGISLGGSLTLSGSHYSFIDNSAKREGGAIHAGDILFSDCSSVLFDSNSTPLEGTNSTGGAGGAIYSSGYVLFDDCNNIVFKNNSARYGAVAVATTLHFDHCGSISIENNISQFNVINITNNGSGALKIESCSGDIVFRNNETTSTTGAVIGGDLMCMSNTGKILFSKNYSASSGGVVSGYSNSHILSGNQDVVFSENYSGGGGGVFYSGTLEISNNKRIEFSKNSASSCGAIYMSNRKLSIVDNDEILFIGNLAWGENNQSAGAVGSSDFQVSSNKYLLCQGNKAFTGWGGAFMAYSNGNLLMYNNVALEFLSNSAGTEGGAIYGGQVRIVDNTGYLNFLDNSAYSGGAISGTIDLSRNGQICFSNNSAVVHGGALKGTMLIENNENVLFDNNSAITGGAIYTSGGLISITGNDRVSFIGNRATADSSAIHAVNSWSRVKLVIENNGRVEFLNNKQGVGAYAVNAEDLVVSGNDYVVFQGNINSLRCYKSVIDTKIGSASSAIHFYDAFTINNNYSTCAEFNTTGDGTILLSGSAAQCEVSYAATLGGGTMEWEDRAQLTIGGNYTVGSEYKGASLVFNQSGRKHNLKSLTVNGNLILQNCSDITFKLDQATEMSGTQGFVFVDDFLILDKSVSVNVDVYPDVSNNNSLISLITACRGVEYEGITYTYRENIGWSYTDESGTHTRDSINELFSWISFDGNHGLVWIDNILYYSAVNGLRNIYKVVRLYTGETWRGDSFDYYDINKRRVYHGKDHLWNDNNEINDNGLCWFITGCNIIEYWHDNYAPLYQSDYLPTNNKKDRSSEVFYTYYRNVAGLSNSIQIGGHFADVMKPWFLGEMDCTDTSKLFKKGFNKSQSPWAQLFSEDNLKKLSLDSVESMSVFQQKMQSIFCDSGSAIYLSYTIEDPLTGKNSGHAITLWSAVTMGDTCVLEFTNSDMGKDEISSLEVKVVPHRGKNRLILTRLYSVEADENYEIQGKIRYLNYLCYMTTPDGMDEMLEDFYSEE